MYLKLFKSLFFFVLISTVLQVSAQRSKVFEKEVTELTAQDSSVSKEKIILFTGSSTIRIWKDIQTYFPEYNVLNRGFGGSQMTDLLYYSDKLIVRYHPKKIFIYEGDNDLAAKKSPEEIVASADSILRIIRTRVSKRVPVLFISAKPSVARWHMKDQYMDYNAKLKAWAVTKKKVIFVDTWAPMLDQNGEVQKDIFIADGLHMNKKGYEIWARVLKPYVY